MFPMSCQGPHLLQDSPTLLSHARSEKITKGEVSLLKPGRRCGFSAPEALVIGLRLLGVKEQLPLLHCNYLDAFMQLYALLLPSTHLLSRLTGALQACMLAHAK